MAARQLWFISERAFFKQKMERLSISAIKKEKLLSNTNNIKTHNIGLKLFYLMAIWKLSKLISSPLFLYF